MKTVSILGSTGSIGVSALQVAEQYRDSIRVVGLSTNRNVELLREQISRFAPTSVAVLDEAAGRAFEREMRGRVSVFVGPEGMEEFAVYDKPDVVLSALVGFAGLRPTVRAIQDGRTIALANKETLVAAGEYVTALLQEHNVRMLPVDSEHSAIWQCLAGEDAASVHRLILTASGGPFRDRLADSLSTVTVADALNHPNWNMGRKITIDSATLMNKGLEVHEAHWLFHVPADRIDVVVHRQSIVHSLVEFTDGSLKAQLGTAEMKLPILYALLYPQRGSRSNGRLGMDAMRELTFVPPDRAMFPCLQLAYDALDAGGTAPAVLNAANEIAVDAFLGGSIGFTDIPRVVSHALTHAPNLRATFDNVLAADRDARLVAESAIAGRDFS